jgi:hypothetical protein
MMPATGEELLTRTRELPRSTIKEQAAKLRSPGSPTEEKMARVQAGRPVPEHDRQVPQRRIVADSRMPSVVRTEEALPRRIAVVASQAAKACPHNPRREVEAVQVVEAVAPVAAAVPVAVVAAVAVAVVEEDKEERI